MTVFVLVSNLFFGPFCEAFAFTPLFHDGAASAPWSPSRCYDPMSVANSFPRRMTALFAAKMKAKSRRRGVFGASSSKKQRSNNKATAKTSRKTKSTMSATSIAPSELKQGAKKKSTGASSKPAPPWQVLSTKEAKLNIEREKERREKARQGIHENPASLESSKKTLSKNFLNEADQRFLKWRRFNPVTAPNGMRFVGSYLDRRLPPSLGVPEIAFLGRSNVGKSSLLNRLVSTASGRSASSDQARVGKTPGATASVNLYALTTAASKAKNQDQTTKYLLGFADLPGFGYAKLSKNVQESVQEAAEHYLAKRRELALGILLVDLRRAPPSDDDRTVLAALYDMGIPILVLATKIDKIKSQQQQSQNLQAIQKGLGLPEGQPLAVSSITGEGIKPLWNIILEACETSVAEFKATYQDENEERDQDGTDGESVLTLNEEFYDDDDLMYEQGYDWIHDDYGAYENDEFDMEQEEFNSDWAYDEEIMEDDLEDGTLSSSNDPDSWKSLKARARDMERRGEL